MAGTWGYGAGGLETVRAELGAADAAVQEALDGLRRAEALGWQSTAGDAFRARLADVVTGVRHQTAALDEARLATARLAARG